MPTEACMCRRAWKGLRTLRYWIMRSMGSRLNSRNELLSLMEYRAVSKTSSGMRVLLNRRASCSRARSCQSSQSE